VSIHYFRFTHRGTGSRQRAPLLERLLARADEPAALSDWRADAFRLIAPAAASMPGLGAAALCAEQEPVGAASVFIATPVHYLAEMSNVRLAADGILSLTRPEAEALAADFNRVWHDAGMRLIPGGRAGRPTQRDGEVPERTSLFFVTDRALDATTRDPEDVLDRHIESYLPVGADAPRLRRLMSEVEMWLFEHGVNRARQGSATPAVSGLWLWGGGAALASLPPVEGWTAGDDVFFAAFGARAASRSPPASGVVVIGAEPGTDAWREAESQWLERSAADLRSGRIERLDLSAGDRCFSIEGRWNWRPWRRRKPWWEFFQ
jgi:hypothetical protein